MVVSWAIEKRKQYKNIKFLLLLIFLSLFLLQLLKHFVTEMNA